MAGLTIGLLAAGTGGVIAGGGDHHHGGSGGGNATNTQYGGECNISNGSGNVGDNNGADAENNACNENTFITENITNTTTITNTSNTAPVTIQVIPAAPAAGSVLAAKTTKAAISNRHITIHLNVPRRSHLTRVTLKLDGKTFKVLKGKAASKNINLTNLPCGTGATTITVVAVTSSGKNDHGEPHVPPVLEPDGRLIDHTGRKAPGDTLPRGPCFCLLPFHTAVLAYIHR